MGPKTAERPLGRGDLVFSVRLDDFEGPFDLLLQLISARQLDVTRLALGQVTDDFIAYVHRMDAEQDLEQTSSFLVIAATLLEMKTAKLLPSDELQEAEQIQAYEAQDLLFARLLQYRAYKQISFWMADRWQHNDKIFAHPGGLSSAVADDLPTVIIPRQAESILAAAIKAFQPRQVEQIPVEQLHISTISLSEQVSVVAQRIRQSGHLSFAELVKDVDRLMKVTRFLAILELYRSELIEFEQTNALGQLMLWWNGGADYRQVMEAVGEGEWK